MTRRCLRLLERRRSARRTPSSAARASAAFSMGSPSRRPRAHAAGGREVRCMSSSEPDGEAEAARLVIEHRALREHLAVRADRCGRARRRRAAIGRDRRAGGVGAAGVGPACARRRGARASRDRSGRAGAPRRAPARSAARNADELLVRFGELAQREVDVRVEDARFVLVAMVHLERLRARRGARARLRSPSSRSGVVAAS